MNIEEIEDNLSWLYDEDYSKESIIDMLIGTIYDADNTEEIIEYLKITYQNEEDKGYGE
jgi:hypothetical protein